VSQLTPLRPARDERNRRRGRDRPPENHEPLFVKGGRAWINGREVGGTDPRYAHLNRSYD
jgi:hypothetical protein